MTTPSPTPPPLYLTGPARRIAAIEDPTARANAAIEALVERDAELEQYRALYAESYGTILDPKQLEHRDPYRAELIAIGTAAEALAVRPVPVSQHVAGAFAQLADDLNHRRQGDAR